MELTCAGVPRVLQVHHLMDSCNNSVGLVGAHVMDEETEALTVTAREL